MIELKNISKRYGKNGVFDINLKIGPKEKVGIVGKNGSGKTTILSILAKLIKPSTGDFFCNDTILGYMPHETEYFLNDNPYLSLLFFAKLASVKEPNIKVTDILEKVGLSENSKKNIRKLSNGMKKSLGIAQAIIHDPNTLILDEPFNGLDYYSKIKMRHIIRSFDGCLIISSHEIEQIEKLCTRIIVLKEGRIITDDKITNLRERSSKVVIELKNINSKIINLLKKNFNDCIFENNEITISKCSVEKISDFLKKHKIRTLSVKKGVIEDFFG